MWGSGWSPERWDLWRGARRCNQAFQAWSPPPGPAMSFPVLFLSFLFAKMLEGLVSLGPFLCLPPPFYLYMLIHSGEVLMYHWLPGQPGRPSTLRLAILMGHVHYWALLTLASSWQVDPCGCLAQQALLLLIVGSLKRKTYWEKEARK